MLFNLFLMVCSLVIIVSIIKADELENGKDQGPVTEGTYTTCIDIDLRETIRESRLVTWEVEEEEIDYEELYREGLRKKFKMEHDEWKDELLKTEELKEEYIEEKPRGGLFSFTEDLEERSFNFIDDFDKEEFSFTEEEEEEFEKGLFSFSSVI